MKRNKANPGLIHVLAAVVPACFCCSPVAQAHEIWFHCPQKDIRVGDTVRVEYGIGETLFTAPDPNWGDWLAKELAATKVSIIDPDGERTEMELKRETAVLAGAFVRKRRVLIS